jgi:hypothetical protein
MRLVSRGFALAGIVTVVVGCAAGNADPPGPGNAGSGGGSGVAGTSGMTGGGPGTAGTAPCQTPPVVTTSWTIGQKADGTGPEISCATAGAATVQLFMNTVRSQFSCDAKMGVSAGLTPGTYTPNVLLASAQGTVLSQGGLKPVTVPSCGVLDLGALRFVVMPTGAAGGGGTAGARGSSGTAGAGGSSGTAGAGGSSGTAGTGGGTGPCNALPIFGVHSCAAAMACHDAAGSAAGFNMSPPGWEKNLVGKFPKAGGAQGLGSACLGAGMPYLVAGSSPATGLFLDKLKAAKPVCGAQMPLIPPNLSAQELDCVQRWANGLTKP